MGLWGAGPSSPRQGPSDDAGLREPLLGAASLPNPDAPRSRAGQGWRTSRELGLVLSHGLPCRTRGGHRGLVTVSRGSVEASASRPLSLPTKAGPLCWLLGTSTWEAAALTSHLPRVETFRGRSSLPSQNVQLVPGRQRVLGSWRQCPFSLHRLKPDPPRATEQGPHLSCCISTRRGEDRPGGRGAVTRALLPQGAPLRASI